MTLVLDLPAAVEAAIQQDAARLGTTPEAFAMETLLRLYPEADGGSKSAAHEEKETKPKTGAELLAIMRRDNLFINREGQPDSPQLARQIREKAWKRS